jgi:nitroreductase
MAICPQGAISHSEFPSTTIRAIQFEQMPATEQVMTLLKTRRSIRAFRDKPVPKETIARIIDGGRFAPSGHNSQSTEFLVIQDKAVLNQVSAMVIEYLKFEIKRFTNPLFKSLALMGGRERAESGLHEIPRFKQMTKSFESGSFSCSPNRRIRRCKCLISAAECFPGRPLNGYRALLHRMGDRSMSRSYGASLEPAHSRLDWHSTWKPAVWRISTRISNPQV